MTWYNKCMTYVNAWVMLKLNALACDANSCICKHNAWKICSHDTQLLAYRNVWMMLMQILTDSNNVIDNSWIAEAVLRSEWWMITQVYWHVIYCCHRHYCQAKAMFVSSYKWLYAVNTNAGIAWDYCMFCPWKGSDKATESSFNACQSFVSLKCCKM